MLTLRFDKLCMFKDKTLSNLYPKLCDIVNKLFDLGEKIYEFNLV